MHLKGYWISSFLWERFIGFLKRKEIANTFCMNSQSCLQKSPFCFCGSSVSIFPIWRIFLYRFDLTKNLLKLYLIECILSLTFPAYHLEQATKFRRLLKLSGCILYIGRSRVGEIAHFRPCHYFTITKVDLYSSNLPHKSTALGGVLNRTSYYLQLYNG